MTSLFVTALVSAIPVLGIMGIMSLRHQRLDRFKDFPQPKTSVVWGHMAVLAEEMKKALKDAQFGRSCHVPLRVGRHVSVLGDEPPCSIGLGVPPQLYDIMGAC